MAAAVPTALERALLDLDGVLARFDAAVAALDQAATAHRRAPAVLGSAELAKLRRPQSSSSDDDADGRVAHWLAHGSFVVALEVPHPAMPWLKLVA